MRRLGKKLGVEAMSLYHHFKNKEEILNGIVDLIFNEIEWPADAPWKPAMRQRGISVRQVLRKHPWAVRILESRPNPGMITLAYHDAVLGNLRRGGLSVPICAHAYSVLDSYTYGFVMQEQNLPFETAEELKVVAEQILASFPAGKYPHLLELTMEHILKPEYSYAEEFLIGLDLVLDGIERLSANS